MGAAARNLVLAACVMAGARNISAQEPTTAPSVVLLQIPAQDLIYPPIAQSARVTGTVLVRVLVNPDGSEAEVTVFPQASLSWRLLHGAAVDAASRATFECRGCTQSATPHLISFVFSLDGVDREGKPLPPVWKQTGDATSEVTLFGQVPMIGGGAPTKPFHVRAARCLWLWRCSKQSFVTPIM